VSNDPDEPNGPGGRNYPPIGGGTSVNIQGLSQATSQINAFNQAIANLQSNLTKMAQQMPGQASTISSSINKVGSSASGGGGGGGFMSTMGNIPQAMFGAINEKGWMRDLMMFPTRFMRSAITDNRSLALQASGGLGMQAFGAGTNTQAMMGALAGQFGNVLGGSPADLVNLMNAAGQFGAGIDWRKYAGGQGAGPNGMGGGPGGPRAGGFFRSVFEAQRMNPAADVGSLAGAIGGYAGNVGAQQQSAFLTGGAFSMIGPGNSQKSISEWATGILKWLQNLRGGPQRGQPFTYAELMSQNFPGSNMDAWLTANGVTPDMKQFFWTYALAQAGRGTSAVDQLFTSNSAVQTSVAFNRLQASAAQTRTGFRLAGTMSGAYANKEQANQFFSELTGHLLNQVLPSAMSSGALSYMQYLPDTIEEIIMQLAERTGLGGLGAGVVGWGGAGVLQNLLGAGDVGDVGDYGSMGGTSTAGLHPDMRKRVDAMMAANPNISVTSGYRDLGTQQRLKRQGVGRVSGRPSAHTRGMAADLGPSSQYGWISRNARRFGLRSGRGQGEPWHVGMGDIGDPLTDMIQGIAGSDAMNALQQSNIGSTMTNLFTSLFKGFVGGSTPEEQISGIGGASASLMKILMGLFGGETNLDRIKYRDVYSTMVAAANESKGLPTGVSGVGQQSMLQQLLAGTLGQSIFGGGGGGATGATGGEGFSGAVHGDFSGDALSRAIATANAAYAAGWRGDDLFKIVSIAGRETNWQNIHAYNAQTKDDSYGLTMINMLGSLGPANRRMFGITNNEELLDPNVSMRASKIIHDQTNKYGGFFAWGPYKGKSELYDTEDYEQPMARKALAAAFPSGYGDVDGSGYAYTIPGASNGGNRLNFYNNFTIDGGGAGGGGLDVRRTATLLADQLEQEMNRRMARRN
jgi:hypothetical protein